MRVLQCVLCLLGGIIGAGFASGRELWGFFASYGVLAPVLCCVAVAAITALSCRVMRMGCGVLNAFERGYGIPGALLTGLLVITGGAMLAAAGEACALILPILYAREIGIAVTLIMTIFIAQKPLKILALPSLLLLPLLVFALLLMQGGAVQTADISAPTWLDGLFGFLKALAYAGMNVTLALSVLCDASASLDRGKACRACAWLGGTLLLMMGLGVRALMTAGLSVQRGALPFVLLLQPYGKVGYFIAAALLYLASVSSLAVILRLLLTRNANVHCSHNGRALTFMSILLAAMTGLDALVETYYPALGFMCFSMLVYTLYGRKNASRR